MRKIKTAKLDSRQFGPWALVTGASSGIGREFARQIAANGIHVALAARSGDKLEQLAAELGSLYGIKTRTIVVDLSEPGFMDTLSAGLDGLEVGLVVSNAGTGVPGSFVNIPEDVLLKTAALNSLAHMRITRRMAPGLLTRGRGGVILISAMGAEHGIPMMANDGAGKSFVNSLGMALHSEWKGSGVNMSIVVPGPTDTPVIEKFGLVRDRLPTPPSAVDQCVYEGLRAITKNKMMHVTGWQFRLLKRFIPASVMRSMNGKMLSMGVKDGQPRLEHVG